MPTFPGWAPLFRDTASRPALLYAPHNSLDAASGAGYPIMILFPVNLFSWNILERRT